MLQKMLLYRNITLILMLIVSLVFITLLINFREYSIYITVVSSIFTLFVILFVFNRYIRKLKVRTEEIDAIFKSSRDGIAILDNNNYFIDANPSYLNMVGLSLEELRKITCLSITYPDDISKTEKAMTELQKKGFLDFFEKRCIRKSGEPFYVSMSVALFPEGDKAVLSVRDMTEQRERELELAKNRDRNERYIEIIDKNVITARIKSSGYIKYISSAFVEFLETDRENLIGKNFKDIGLFSDSFSLKRVFVVLRKGREWSGELQLSTKSDTKWIYVNITPISDGYTITAHDITDKKRIEELSIRDRLTGLYNRAKLDEVLNRECRKRSKRAGSTFGVVIIDIDHFKSINDTFGHISGDYVLKEFSHTVQANISGNDIAGRWGGEEFLLILPNRGLDSSFAIAEKLREAIENTQFERIGRVTASFGVSVYIDGDSVDSTIKRADIALYESKESGRNRVTKWELH